MSAVLAGAILTVSGSLLAGPAQADPGTADGGVSIQAYTPPAVTIRLTNKDGRDEEFRVESGRVEHRYERTVNGTWTGWLGLGSPAVTGGISGAANADGRLEVFAHRSGNNDAIHIYQTAPNSGWSSWYSLSGVISTSKPGVWTQVNSGGTLAIAVWGPDSRYHYKTQQAPNCCWTTTWS